jgi:hypothetical protein
MLPERQWLSDVVIVNESSSETAPGDVTVYRSIGEACRALEYWWVEESRGHAFTASGDRLILTVDESRSVTVDRREPCASGTAIVREWLRSAAYSVLQARKARAAKRKVFLTLFEEGGSLPSTVEGLIAYVGFGR